MKPWFLREKIRKNATKKWKLAKTNEACLHHLITGTICYDSWSNKTSICGFRLATWIWSWKIFKVRCNFRIRCSTNRRRKWSVLMWCSFIANWFLGEKSRPGFYVKVLEVQLLTVVWRHSAIFQRNLVSVLKWRQRCNHKFGFREMTMGKMTITGSCQKLNEPLLKQSKMYAKQPFFARISQSPCLKKKIKKLFNSIKSKAWCRKDDDNCDRVTYCMIVGVVVKWHWTGRHSKNEQLKNWHLIPLHNAHCHWVSSHWFARTSSDPNEFKLKLVQTLN